MEYKGKCVLLTQEVSSKVKLEFDKMLYLIFNENKEQFAEGIHYFFIRNREVFNKVEKCNVKGSSPTFYLWTEAGIKKIEEIMESKQPKQKQSEKSKPEKQELDINSNMITKSIPIGQAAKLLFDELGLGQNNMFKVLRELKILQEDGANRNIPYQPYIKQGYFKVHREEKKNNGGVYIKTLVCVPKGLDFIRRRILNG